MFIYKCDRCGKEESGSTTEKYGKITLMPGWKFYDLCPKCTKEFLTNFMKYGN